VGAAAFNDPRTGTNTQHTLTALLRQPVYKSGHFRIAFRLHEHQTRKVTGSAGQTIKHSQNPYAKSQVR
jgi:hypothetical protein